MGTLSGGGNIIISVGEECLIGANAGLGIPLGDRCTVEAGLFVTAGTKVAVLDDQRNTIENIAARHWPVARIYSSVGIHSRDL